MKTLLLVLGATAALFVSSAFAAQENSSAPAKPAASSDAEMIRVQKASYPLETCPVSGKPLGKDAVDTIKDGHLVRTCCDKCAAKLDAAAVKKVNDAVVAAQKKSYPMDVCPMSGEKLDDKAVDHVYGTRLVRFCCTKCEANFVKDPKAVMAKLDKAYVDAQLKTYKLKTCPVSGEELGKMGAAVDYLYGTTLVRFCCNDCVKDMQKDPEAILKKVRAAQ